LGALLGAIWRFQLVSGVLLILYYSNDSFFSFISVEDNNRSNKFGGEVRLIHSIMVNLLFCILFFHIFRGMYYGSMKNVSLWFSGWILFLLFIGVAFFGYVLPWGQISFWGAAVIINFIRVLPVLGDRVVYWLWGGFLVGGATLKFFLCFHFILPFGAAVVIILHLILLHYTGSVFLGRAVFNKTLFFQKFLVKDIVIMCGLFFSFVFILPLFWMEEENFLIVDLISSPLHIKPEWYFLFLYRVLRRVPSKLLGVILILRAVLFFMLQRIFRVSFLYFKYKAAYWYMFIFVFCFLRGLGALGISFLRRAAVLFLRVLYFLGLFFSGV